MWTISLELQKPSRFMFCIQVPVSDPVLTNFVLQITGEFERDIHALIQSIGRLPILTVAILNNGEPKAGQ